ncbi:MAG TPA: biliverdin-producing heme oxygenase, partial [Solirubrobacterales bacterium]|nr:biliverdin-producing heme oxygenase [Solirubrobacterales bacterium]
MTPSRRLRQATSEAHDRLERTDFARALGEKRVARQEYADYLRALWVVVATVGDEVRRHGTTRERDLLGPLADWAGVLEADLEAVAASTSTSNADAQRAALRLVRSMRSQVGRDTPFVLGFSYALMGSHLGNLSVAAGVSEALGLEGGHGTRYLRASEAAGPDAWPRFRARLDETLDEDQVAEAERGALATFDAFGAILAALVPGARRVHHVTALNPEAGDHPVPQDPALIALSNRVAGLAMERFPYLGFRFGGRGDRYARSDGAWLLTLCDLGPAAAGRQADWLAGVLSARGIPT